MEGSCPRGPNIFLRWVKIHLPRGFNTFLAEVVRLHLPLFFIQPYCSKNLLVRLSETFFTSSDTYHYFMCERMLEVFFLVFGGDVGVYLVFDIVYLVFGVYIWDVYLVFECVYFSIWRCVFCIWKCVFVLQDVYLSF